MNIPLLILGVISPSIFLEATNTTIQTSNPPTIRHSNIEQESLRKEIILLLDQPPTSPILMIKMRHRMREVNK